MNKEDLNRDNPQHPNQTLRLIIPIPPTQNHAYVNKRVGKRFQRVLSGEAQAYMKHIQELAKDAIANQKWIMEENDTWYVVKMYFYYPDKIKRDNHNLFKVPFDALEGYIYKNDYYLMPKVEYVGLDRNNPHVVCVFNKLDKESVLKYTN